MNVDKSWLDEYNSKKSIMCPENPLEKYFTDKEIAGCKIDTVELGTIKITSGDIVACDPTACLDHNISPFFDKFPKGEFKVTASIVVDEQEEMDSKIAIVRIKFNDNAPAVYREALIDTGLAAFMDRDGYDKLAARLTKSEEENEDFDAYTDIYSSELEKSAKDNPKYQYPDGDWANININDKNNAVLFSSPYGEGYFPVYVAEDKDGNICQLLIQFIDVELSDDEEIE